MKKNLFVSISLLSLLFSCKKDGIDLHKYPGLPDATQSGENTMGCLINGKPWVAQKEGTTIGWHTFPIVDCFYGEYRKNISNYDSLYFSIYSRMWLGKNVSEGRYNIEESLFINLQPINKAGKYFFKDLMKNKIEYWQDSINRPIKIFELDPTRNSYIEITKLDTFHNIISGLFDLKLIEIEDKNDTVRITNGRFDALYTPL